MHAWLQDLFVQVKGVGFYRDKLLEEAELHVVAAWAILQAPLVLQQGMINVHNAVHKGFQLDN